MHSLDEIRCLQNLKKNQNFQIVLASEDVRKSANVFSKKEANHDSVAETSNQLFKRLYAVPYIFTSFNTF